MRSVPLHVAQPDPADQEPVDIRTLAPREGERVRGDQILRFRRGERILHWAIAIPFLTCVLSAAILYVVYNHDPQRPYRWVFSWAHRIAGSCLLVAPPLTMLLHWRDYRVFLNNIKEGAIFRKDDLKWLLLQGPAAILKRIQVPEEGKFNGGEKLNFIANMVGYPVMGTTGIIIWVTSSAILPWLVHWTFAIAMVPLVAGHIFLATINPSTRKGLSGMFSGWVDVRWASHHYRRWFREEFGDIPVVHTPNPFEELGLPVPTLITTGTALDKMKIAFLGMGWVAAFLLGGYLVRQRFFTPAGAAPTGIAYIQQDQALLVLPSDDAEQLAGGPLYRGARVSSVNEFGEFSLVQDVEGRTGWVPTDVMGRDAPALSPAQSFPDCKLGLGEAAAPACEERARGMLESCRAACPVEIPPVCAKQCTERHAACVDGCRGGLGRGDAPVAQAAAGTAARPPAVTLEPPPRSPAKDAPAHAKRGKHKPTKQR